MTAYPDRTVWIMFPLLLQLLWIYHELLLDKVGKDPVRKPHVY